MQNEDVQKLIFEKYQQLPPQLQAAITSADFSTNLRSIANKYNLHFDQIGSLETETMLVLLGIEHSDDFLKNIQRQAGLTRQMAETLVVEINRIIFAPIRQYMIKKVDSSQIPNEPQNPEPQSEFSLSKEDILNEIESPMNTEGIVFQKNISEEPDYDGHGGEVSEQWDHEPVTISSKLLEDKLSEVVKLPKEHIDIRIDVDAMEKAEEEHELEEKQKRNSYLEWQERQKKLAEEKKSKNAAPAEGKTVDSLSKKNIPPLRVRKAYESDPYREPVE